VGEIENCILFARKCHACYNELAPLPNSEATHSAGLGFDFLLHTDWHQVHQYEAPIDELAASLESAKKRAQGRLRASSNRSSV
jgi:hypothetical protein